MSARFSFPNHPFFYYFNGGLMEARMRMGGSGNLSALKRRGATKDIALFSRLNYLLFTPTRFFSRERLGKPYPTFAYQRNNVLITLI